MKGKENVIVGALSRVSPLPITEQDEYQKDIIPAHIPTTEIPASVVEFRKAKAEDTTSGLLIQAVTDGWPESRKDWNPLLLDYWTYREETSAENGLFFKGHRLFIPEKLCNRTLQTIHEGHVVVENMQQRVQKSVFWPQIITDILQTAQSCKMCQTFCKNQQRQILMPHEAPLGPWKKIGTDFFEFESTNYLQIADYYSHFPILRRMRSTTTNVTIDVIKQVCGEYVVPKTVM